MQLAPVQFQKRPRKGCGSVGRNRLLPGSAYDLCHFFRNVWDILREANLALDDVHPVPDEAEDILHNVHLVPDETEDILQSVAETKNFKEMRELG